MKKALAIFDFDGTLVKGHVWEAISRYFREQGLRKGFLLRFYLTHIPMWYLTKFKLIDVAEFRIQWMVDYAGIFKGYAKDEVTKVMATVLGEQLESDLNKPVLEELRRHQSEGDEVVMVSGAFEALLELFSREVGVEHVLGTQLEFVEGRCTGRTANIPCMGPEKLRRLQELIEVKGWEVEWATSYSYADNISDLPVLEVVGNPVAVNPDKELKSLAQEKGWRILEQPAQEEP
ncbi:MAG: HAD-IB family hydrolase [Anaerolineae bacterium]|nr:HAD-IB family hydrolase [Anaerolineae bacterium]